MTFACNLIGNAEVKTNAKTKINNTKLQNLHVPVSLFTYLSINMTQFSSVYDFFFRYSVQLLETNGFAIPNLNLNLNLNLTLPTPEFTHGLGVLNVALEDCRPTVEGLKTLAA